MEAVFAWKLVYLLSLLYIIIADRTHFLHILRVDPFQLGKLFLSYAFRHVPHLLFEFQQLLIRHVVSIYLNTVLVTHTHYHILQILHIHHPYFLVYFTYILLLCICSCLITSFLPLSSSILALISSFRWLSFLFSCSSRSFSHLYLLSSSSRSLSFYRKITKSDTCNRRCF